MDLKPFIPEILIAAISFLGFLVTASEKKWGLALFLLAIVVVTGASILYNLFLR